MSHALCVRDALDIAGFKAFTSDVVNSMRAKIFPINAKNTHQLMHTLCKMHFFYNTYAYIYIYIYINVIVMY